jgi:hypothetical protein
MNTTATAPARRVGATSRTAAASAKPAAQNVGDLGTNLQYSVEGDELVIRVKLSERHGKSASGKTTIVATSSGNKVIPGTDVTIGINAYVKP